MSQPDPTRQHILVAEDDRSILELVRTRLSVAGYHVSFARNGLEAMEMIPSNKPDGVILDINMPVMDGFDVLRKLKAQPDTAVIPVMMLTARNSVGDVQTALSLGANDFLTKPFRDDLLLLRVARLMRSKGAVPKPQVDYI
jgi:DNA-binding response OmpR family regulator